MMRLAIAILVLSVIIAGNSHIQCSTHYDLCFGTKNIMNLILTFSYYNKHDIEYAKVTVLISISQQ